MGLVGFGSCCGMGNIASPATTLLGQAVSAGTAAGIAAGTQAAPTTTQPSGGGAYSYYPGSGSKVQPESKYNWKNALYVGVPAAALGIGLYFLFKK